MQEWNDQKLINLIKYAPAATVCLFMIIINIVIINDNHEKANESILSLREDVISQQKQQINQQVDQVVRIIEFRKELVLSQLKQQSKSRVDEAHAIASSIFINNPNKPHSEIINMITDALRAIRFNDGRGYFFIFDMEGNNILHGLKPHLEGTSVWNAQDLRGTFILREHIHKIQQQQGEAFYHWWYQKPGYPVTQEFEKVGYGKEFKPLNWFIGTGEYISDVENDVKATLLKWISEYDYGEHQRMFVIDTKGHSLAKPITHKQHDFIDHHAHTNQQLVKTILDKVTSKGSFIEFGLSGSGEEIKPPVEIIYAQLFNSWQWIIGTHFNTYDFEEYLNLKQKELLLNNHENFMKVLTLSIFSTFLMVGGCLFAGNLIANRFRKFKYRIEKDFKKLNNSKATMEHMAMHDSLTGLPNRACFLNQIKQDIKSTIGQSKKLAVALVDIDDFKKINDVYGHSSADQLLKEVSRRVEQSIAPQDTAARFGGDEFGFCFPDIENTQQVHQKVSLLQDIFNREYTINGTQYAIKGSIGISMYPSDSHSPEGLIRKADIVLYKSKAVLNGLVTFFNSEIDAQVSYEYKLEEQLRNALTNNEISVLYQPQITTRNEQLQSVEALARWNNPKLGSVSPDVFIGIAEKTGLIIDLGLFIFRKACEDILAASPNGKGAINVSINISPQQLMQINFAESITQIVNEVGIDIHRITIEVTENLVLQDLKMTAIILNELKALKFGISLDDFGTGYSSLSYLNELPITEIKIDRCFINNINSSNQSNALVKAIFAISEAYDISVVAEGVEEREQFLTLKSYQCDLIQGYYFDKPLTLTELQQKYFNFKLASNDS
ncbi:cache domain-containing protein [Shewanella olleyana]|uniref:bifunctional diguanylate cyclase/phosphodiesterase n=1 Tax=Shewanella olleyana TaxID=135626 RepID=UPI00200C4668|nr:cache domain-containing protein [Shewanella olleyana]MCL1065785.1 cache domain-containing protein [Shewanella olleyana]